VAPSRSLLKETRGAVLAEFAIALVPLLLMYFSFLQVAYMYGANLAFQHATLVAARAAVVIAEPRMNPGNNGPETDITEAAKLALGPWKDRFANVQATHSGASDQYGMMTTTLNGTYTCNVPMGNQVVCDSGQKPMTFKVALPLQGARYTPGLE
jgi:Flp pilus assembly protein TadG